VGRELKKAAGGGNLVTFHVGLAFWVVRQDWTDVSSLLSKENNPRNCKKSEKDLLKRRNGSLGVTIELSLAGSRQCLRTGSDLHMRH